MTIPNSGVQPGVPIPDVVPDVSSLNAYVGDGFQLQFFFTFRVDEAGWVDVYLDDVLVPEANYTITLNPDQKASPGGFIDFALAPAVDVVIVIRRDTPRSQNTYFAPYGPFPAEDNELGLDKLTMQIQDLHTYINWYVDAGWLRTDTTNYTILLESNAQLNFDEIDKWLYRHESRIFGIDPGDLPIYASFVIYQHVPGPEEETVQEVLQDIIEFFVDSRGDNMLGPLNFQATEIRFNADTLSDYAIIRQETGDDHALEFLFNGETQPSRIAMLPDKSGILTEPILEIEGAKPGLTFIHELGGNGLRFDYEFVNGNQSLFTINANNVSADVEWIMGNFQDFILRGSGEDTAWNFQGGTPLSLVKFMGRYETQSGRFDQPVYTWTDDNQTGFYLEGIRDMGAAVQDLGVTRWVTRGSGSFLIYDILDDLWKSPLRWIEPHVHDGVDAPQVTHSDLLAIGPNDHHNQAHLFAGSDHSDVTLTAIDQRHMLVWDVPSQEWVNTQSYQLAEANPTGLIDGGELNIGPGANDIEVLAGKGVIIDSYTNPDLPPVSVNVEWTQINLPIAAPAVAGSITWFTIDQFGALQQYVTVPTPVTVRDEILVGSAIHNGTSWGEVSSPTVINNTAHSFDEFMNRVVGPSFVIDGGEVNEAALFTLDQDAGTVWELNRNWHVDKKDPHREAIPALVGIQWRYTNRDFSDVSALTGTVDAAMYDNAGTVEAVGGPANTATIQQLYRDTRDNLWILWGQTTFDNFTEAAASIVTATVIPQLLQHAVLLGYIVVERAKTDWDPDESVFIYPQGSGGSGGGGVPITQHVDLSGIMAGDHQHKLYETSVVAGVPNHLDIDASTALAIRNGLFWREADDKFQPEFRVNWIPQYTVGGTFYPQDMVANNEFISLANTETIEGAFPTEVGGLLRTYPDVPPFLELSEIANVRSGHFYTIAQVGELRGIWVWVPEVSGDTNHTLIVIADPNGTPRTTTFADLALLPDQWNLITAFNTLVVPGQEYLVYLESQNFAGTSQVTGGWTRGVNSNIAPDPNSWNRSTQYDVVRIDDTDLDTVGRRAELEGIIAGSTIQFVETAAPQNSITFRVVNVNIALIGYVEYEVTLQSQGINEPTIGQTTTMTADIPIAQSTQFSYETDKWITEPLWTSIASFLQFDGVTQPVGDDVGYGIDLAFQQLTQSTDWDLIKIGGGGGGGGGDFTPDLFTGAGTSGYVPDPVTESGRVLSDDGSWVAGGGAVSSVFTRTGAVVAEVGDYAAFYSGLLHTHTESDITDLGNYSVVGHQHTAGDIVDFNPADYLKNTTDTFTGRLDLIGTQVVTGEHSFGTATDRKGMFFEGTRASLGGDARIVTYDENAGLYHGLRLDGSTVKLDRQGATKLEAHSTGVTVTGLTTTDTLTVPANSSESVTFGTLGFRLTNSTPVIQTTAAQLYLDADTGNSTGVDVSNVVLRARKGSTNQTVVRTVANTAGAYAELLYNNNVKLATISTGINVSGDVIASAGDLMGQNGSTSNPSHTFIAATNSGMHWTGTDLHFSRSNVDELKLVSLGVEIPGLMGIGRTISSGVAVAITAGANSGVLVDGTSNTQTRFWGRNAAFTNTFTVDGNGSLFSANYVKTLTGIFTGSASFATGKAVEVGFPGDYGRVLSYDRSAGTRQSLRLDANSVDIYHNGAFAGRSFTSGWRMNYGSVSAPSYSFNGDENTGMYRPTTDQIAFTTAGVKRFTIDNNGVNAQYGTPTRPGYAFTGDTDTGFYRAGTGLVSFVSDAVGVAQFNPGGFEVSDGKNYSWNGQKILAWGNVVCNGADSGHGLNGCTVSSTSVGLATITLTTALTSTANAKVIVTPGSSSATVTSKYLFSSTTSIIIGVASIANNKLTAGMVNLSDSVYTNSADTLSFIVIDG